MGCTEVMLRTSITFVCKVDVAVLLGLSVYASTGIVVNRDNPVKRVKDLSSTYKCNFLGADNKQ